MKCPRREDRRNNTKQKRSRVKALKNDQITESLKACLQKICELQANLQRSEDQEYDAEAAGFAACATETLRFLSAEGISPDHPMFVTLQRRLLGDQNGD